MISWESKKQTSVASSSKEAENIAVCAPTQEALWLSRLLKEFGCQFSKPVTLLEVNQACIYYSRNPGDFQGTKHIDQKYFFLRERVNEGNVIFHKVKTTVYLADIFTKPLISRVLQSGKAFYGSCESREIIGKLKRKIIYIVKAYANTLCERLRL